MKVSRAPLSVPNFQFSKDLKFAQNGIITESVIEPSGIYCRWSESFI